MREARKERQKREKRRRRTRKGRKRRERGRRSGEEEEGRGEVEGQGVPRPSSLSNAPVVPSLGSSSAPSSISSLPPSSSSPPSSATSAPLSSSVVFPPSPPPPPPLPSHPSVEEVGDEGVGSSRLSRPCRPAQWRCFLGCGKSYKKSSGRSIRRHALSCYRRHFPLECAGRSDGEVHELLAARQEEGIVHTGLRAWRLRQSRRAAHDLPPRERWECPLGCRQYYRSTSSKSIEKHLETCTGGKGGRGGRQQGRGGEDSSISSSSASSQLLTAPGGGGALGEEVVRERRDWRSGG